MNVMNGCYTSPPNKSCNTQYIITACKYNDAAITLVERHIGYFKGIFKDIYLS